MADLLVKELILKLKKENLYERLDLELTDDSLSNVSIIASDLINALSVLDEEHTCLEQTCTKNDQLSANMLQNAINIRSNLQQFTTKLVESVVPSETLRQLWTVIQFFNSLIKDFVQFSPFTEDLSTKLTHAISSHLLLPIDFKISNARTSKVNKPASFQQQYYALEEVMRKNDQQYAEQIQRYNTMMQQMKSKLSVAYNEIQRISYIQVRVQELQAQNMTLKDERYRSEIVINNMARKIRNYQKEKGGSMFMSPPSHIHSAKRLVNGAIVSPVASRLQIANPNQSRTMHYEPRSQIPIMPRSPFHR